MMFLDDVVGESQWSPDPTREQNLQKYIQIQLYENIEAL